MSYPWANSLGACLSNTMTGNGSKRQHFISHDGRKSDAHDGNFGDQNAEGANRSSYINEQHARDNSWALQGPGPFHLNFNPHNFNKWCFVRKLFPNKDNDRVAEHLFEIHDQFCQKCSQKDKRHMSKGSSEPVVPPNACQIILNTNNCNKWVHMRNFFRKRDDDTVEHLFDIHDNFCQACRQKIEVKKAAKKKKYENKAAPKPKNAVKEEITDHFTDDFIPGQTSGDGHFYPELTNTSYQEFDRNRTTAKTDFTSTASTTVTKGTAPASNSNVSQVVSFNATNFNKWAYLRKFFHKKDDELIEHLFEIHDMSCKDCFERIADKKAPKASKRKHVDEGETLVPEVQELGEEEKRVKEESDMMRKLMGFTGFKSNKLGTPDMILPSTAKRVVTEKPEGVVKTEDSSSLGNEDDMMNKLMGFSGFKSNKLGTPDMAMPTAAKRKPPAQGSTGAFRFDASSNACNR